MSEAKWRELLADFHYADDSCSARCEMCIGQKALAADVERIEAELTRWRAMPLSKRLAVEMERADDCEKRAETAERAMDERIFMALGAQRNAEGLLKEAEAALAKHHEAWALDAGERCPVCGLVRR